VFGKVVYWLAVIAVSVALVIGLVLFFESRDAGSLNKRGSAVPTLRA
jgi:hypothetical protein